MSKNRRNVQNPSPLVHHTQDAARGSTVDPTGNHLVYPQLIEPKSRLEVVSKTVRSMISGFASKQLAEHDQAPTTQDRINESGAYDAYTQDPALNTPEHSYGDVSWARWSCLNRRYLLLVAYQRGGFHLWDLSKLDTAREVLYLSSFGPVASACVISGVSSSSGSKSDVLLLLSGTAAETTLTVYSLVTGDIAKRVSIPYASEVQANSRFAVVSVGASEANAEGKETSALLVFDVVRDFAFVYSFKQLPNCIPPTFALSSGRMLAYTAATSSLQLPASSNSASYPPIPSDTAKVDARSSQGSALSSSLAYVGGGMLAGALRLGSGVVEGVKIGVNAAGYGGSKSRPVSGEYRHSDAYSRSAPNSQSPLSSQRHYRRASGQIRSAISGPGVAHMSGNGSWIIVIDLQPLASAAIEDLETISASRSFIAKSPPLTRVDFDQHTLTRPLTVAEMYYQPKQTLLSSVGKGSPIATPSRADSRVTSQENLRELEEIPLVTSMSWNRRGSMIAVGARESTGVQVYQVRRKVHSTARSRGLPDSDENRPDGDLLHVYDLHRGLTAATIESMAWSNDGLWNAFASEHGTIHIHAVDPDGGAPDASAHIAGQSRDGFMRTVASSTRLQPITRLRQPYTETLSPEKVAQPESADTDSMKHFSRRPAITFLDRSTSTSSRLIPLKNMDTSTESSLSNGFQDVLVFDPPSGRVLLWRCSLETYADMEPRSDSRALERTSSVVHNSDPDANRASPSTSAPLSSVLSGVARMTGLGSTTVSRIVGTKSSSSLTGSGAVIASWNLRRGDDWPEIRHTTVGISSESFTRTKSGDLSFAELSPSPIRSARLFRPLYLSHQFQFGALNTDYHALVRRLEFHPPFESVWFRKDSVIVRTGEGFADLDRHSTVPSDFDSEANFLGSDGPILDLGESPILGGHLGLVAEHMPFSSSLASTSSMQSRPIARQSFDDILTSAMDSRMVLDASYSPAGSPSDIASPGYVIPMLPNGRPGSAGSSIGSGLDAVVRGTTRVSKDVWSGIAGVRSPRLMPAKRASTDLLKFDEAEEMFMVDGLEIDHEPLHPTTVVTPIKQEGSAATIGPGAWSNLSGAESTVMTDSGMTVRSASTQPSTAETAWIDQQDVYTQAVEEEAKFDDVTGILDEERREREALQSTADSTPISPVEPPKGRTSKKGLRKKKR